MKYTIEGFYQPTLLKYNLDNTDALILRWFIDFKNTSKMVNIRHDGKDYLWVNYSSIINDLPCIGVTVSKAMQRRFQKFIDCGLMTKWIKKDATGTFSMFWLNPIIYDEFVMEQTKMSNGAGQKCPTGLDKNVHTKDSSINNPSINNPINQAKPDSITTQIKDLFDKGNMSLFNEKLSWVGKEKEYGINIQRLIKSSENDIDKIKLRAEILFKKIKNKEFMKGSGFTPSTLLSNWNELLPVKQNIFNKPEAYIPTEEEIRNMEENAKYLA